jgi:hypothetical protein
MTPERRIDRADRARSILDDEIVIEALRTIEASYIEAWKATEPRDAQGREMAWMGVKAAQLFRQKLSRLAQDGDIARAEIARQERDERLRGG